MVLSFFKLVSEPNTCRRAKFCEIVLRGGAIAGGELKQGVKLKPARLEIWGGANF